jgi:hypothetical protein
VQVNRTRRTTHLLPRGEDGHRGVVEVHVQRLLQVRLRARLDTEEGRDERQPERAVRAGAWPHVKEEKPARPTSDHMKEKGAPRSPFATCVTLGRG